MILKFLSKIYSLFVRIRNRSYEKGRIKIFSASVPVISVGNLSVGGSGKTPFTIMLARHLLSLDIRPAVLGRGYKKKNKGEVIVSDGKNILADAKSGGDEMLMTAKKLYSVPVIANEKKYESAGDIHKKFDIDCIILDDGFQHRKLGRDIDILIIDKKTFLNRDVIPLGRLREPFSSIKRADVVCITPDIDRREAQKELSEDQLLIISEIETGELYELFSENNLNTEEIRNLRNGVVAVSAIANSSRFENSLRNAGVSIIKHFAFPDHYHYEIKDLQRMKEQGLTDFSPYMITTEKDAVKLMKFKDFFEENDIKCVVLPISMKITSGRASLIEMINEIIKKNS